MKRDTLKTLGLAAIISILIGCTGPTISQKRHEFHKKAFEAIVGKKEYKTSAVKVGNKRITVGAIIGKNKILTVVRKSKEDKFLDRYGDFEGRTFMSKVDYKVIKQDIKLNLSLLETKKDLEGSILEVADAKEGPCTVISLYDARLSETSSWNKLYNFQQNPTYPYERKGLMYDKDKVTCDLGNKLISFNYSREIITRDALDRIKDRAYKQDFSPDFWDYYDDSGSLIIQEGKLVGLIKDSITVVYSENGKTKQRLDGVFVPGKKIKEFLK